MSVACYCFAVEPGPPLCRLTLGAAACYDAPNPMNVVMGVLRFGFVALIAAFALYVAWLIKRDLDRR